MRSNFFKKLKASKLLREGNVRKDFETKNRIYFSVKSSELHSVFYDKEKNVWSCDCKYFSIKLKPCSHIIACKMLIGKEEL